LYVDDAADGILAATEKYDAGDPVNLGSGQQISMKELGNMIFRMTGFRGEIVWDSSNRTASRVAHWT